MLGIFKVNKEVMKIWHLLTCIYGGSMQTPFRLFECICCSWSSFVDNAMRSLVVPQGIGVASIEPIQSFLGFYIDYYIIV